jgi:probable addiction module antidote protein
MAKTATSKKQKTYSAYNLTIGKLKKGVKTHIHKSTPLLKNPKQIAQVLGECLIEGDVSSFKEVLSTHIFLVGNKKNFSKKIGIGRATLYEALSPNGNPSLETIARIVRSLAT